MEASTGNDTSGRLKHPKGVETDEDTNPRRDFAPANLQRNTCGVYRSTLESVRDKKGKEETGEMQPDMSNENGHVIDSYQRIGSLFGCSAAN